MFMNSTLDDMVMLHAFRSYHTYPIQDIALDRRGGVVIPIEGAPLLERIMFFIGHVHWSRHGRIGWRIY